MHGLILTQSPVISTITFDNKGNVMSNPSPTPNIGQAASVLSNAYFYQSNHKGFIEFDFGRMYVSVQDISVNEGYGRFLIIGSTTFSSEILIELLEKMPSIPIYLQALSRPQIKQLKQYLENEGYQLAPHDQANNSFYRNG